MKVVQCTELPEHPDMDTIYDVMPRSFDLKFYLERIDRNIGWITEREQLDIVYRSTIGIAGCGGMGGLIAATLVRLGVGTIIIFEPETFDISNINRQYAATKKTVGESKAFATFDMISDITDDIRRIVCPQGLTEENLPVLQGYISQCDLIYDEIEFWALGARLTLHSIAREMNIPLLNCNTVGYRTHISCFSNQGWSLEECIGLSTPEAWLLQERIQSKIASVSEMMRIEEEVMKIFIPEVPEYSLDTSVFSTVDEWYRRLRTEGRAIVIATNPPMASGCAADHGLFQLLRKSAIKRGIVLPPEMPGYLMFDVGFWQTKIVTSKWW